MKNSKFLLVLLISLTALFASAQDVILMPAGAAGATSEEAILCGNTYIFKDAGGDANYPGFQNVVFTISAGQPGMEVGVLFNSFVTETNNDVLRIYNGADVTAPLLGEYSGGQLQGVSIASNGTGALTFHFEADWANNRPGWEAEVSCVFPCQDFTVSTMANGVELEDNDTLYVCVEEEINFLGQGDYPDSGTNYDQNDSTSTFTWAFNDDVDQVGVNISKTYTSPGLYNVELTVQDENNCSVTETYVVKVSCGGTCPVCVDFYPGDGTIHTCEGTFWDSGGSTGGYQNNEEATVTFCADNGGRVKATFVQFQLDAGNSDKMIVYDGPDVDAPLIGNYDNANPINNIITATGTCLTFKFVSSEFSTPGIGWKALITCTDPCQEVDLGLTSVPEFSESGDVIRTCPGTDVNIAANLTFPDNNAYYTQTLGNTDIHWESPNGWSSEQSSFTYPVDSAFMAEIWLDVLDVNGCHTYDTLTIISECQDIDLEMHTDATQEQSGEIFLGINEPIHISASYAFPESGACYDQTVGELTWTFGLSNANTGDIIESHTTDTTISYATSGVYDLTLTLTDNKGCEETVVKEIHVGCQPIDVTWTATPAMLGDTIIVCPGEAFNIEIETDYFANNQPYFQADSNMTFNWNLADGTLVNDQMNPGPHIYDASGLYNVYLQIIDVNAGFDVPCVDNTFIPVYAFPDPSLEETAIYVDTICRGESILLDGKTTLEMPTYSAPPLFLPDGTGVSYSSSLTFDMFGDQILSQPNDFMGLCMTLEHSYVGDLEIVLECPNGQTMEILPYPNNGGGNHFGEPCDNWGTTTTGVGYEYCFTPGATSTIPQVSGNFTHDFVDNDGNSITNQGYYPAGDYLPTGSFDELMGCPLNGDWTIHITDNLGSDDGMIFDWTIGFDMDGLVPPDTLQLPLDMRQWTLHSGGSVEINNIDGNRAYATPLDTGNYSFTFIVTSPAGCSYDTVVGPVYVAPVPEWTLQPDTSICGEMTYEIQGELSGGDGDWTFVGPGNAVFADEHSIPTTVTVDAYGDYKFYFTPNTIPMCANPDSVSVTFHEIPTVDEIIDPLDCYGVCTGSVAVTPTGQEVPYTYEWSNSATTNVADNLCAGNIQLTVSSGFCTNEYNYDVPTPSEVHIINSTVVDNLCFGDSNGEVSILADGGSPGYTYAWSPANVSVNSSTLNNLPAGTYQVTVSDMNNCSKSTSLVVSQPDLPLTVNYMTPYDVNCYEAKDGRIDLNVVGGTAPYFYNWELSDGTTSTVQDPEGLDIGIHYVTVTDAHNCVTTASQSLTQPTELQVSYTPVEPSCYGYNDGKIWLETHNATPPYQYQWSTGWTDSSIVNSPAAVYNVTVTDNKGCEKVLTHLVVEQPAPVMVAISDVSPICIGEDATLTMSVTSSPFSPYQYYWNGVLSSESIVVSPLVTTSYTAKVIDNNGCESQEVSKEVRVYEPIEASVELNRTTVCQGASVIVEVDVEGGSPNLEYLLSDGTLVSDSFSIQPYETMEYRLIVRDDCSTPPDTIPFTINVEEPPVPNFHADVKSGCDPLTVNFVQDISTHEEGTKYLWTFEGVDQDHISTSSSPQHIFSNAGFYDVSLEVTNSLGCKSLNMKRGYIQVYPLPEAAFTTTPNSATTVNPVIFFKNNTEGADMCLWYFGDGDSTSAWDITHHYPRVKDNYLATLIASTNYGCVDSAFKYINVAEEVTFYMPNAFTPDNDNLNDTFKPKFNGVSKEDYLMIIYDRWGEPIFETADPEEGWDGTINGKYVQPGMYRYLIRFVDVEGDSHEKSGNLNMIR